jgi:hypothetical protein
MACFHPLNAIRLPSGQIQFSSTSAGHSNQSRYQTTDEGERIEIPCSQCLGCRLERSRQWAMRCVHEASLHKDNCFITLTYDPKHLPPDCGLRKKDFQDFIKRLRKAIHPKKVRYYHCGEYGDNTNRPHYHAILFGYNFSDWTYLFDSPAGSAIYTSPTLEKIWGKGFVTIGEVTFESAAYVARYVVKKITGKGQDVIDEKTGLKPYERYNDFTGEITEVLPEYSTMSRRPGIGHNWISKYKLDCYPKDFTTIRGMRMKPPKYYDKYLHAIDPELYDEIKSGRQYQGYLSDDNSVSRLRQREQVKEAQNKQLKRSL